MSPQQNVSKPWVIVVYDPGKEEKATPNIGHGRSFYHKAYQIARN